MGHDEKFFGVPAPRTTVNTATSAPRAQPQNRKLEELFDFAINEEALVDGDTLVFNAAAGKFVRSKGSVVAAGDPTGTDDETLGYVVGSLWYDTVGPQLWILTDASEGAAVWDEVALV